MTIGELLQVETIKLREASPDELDWYKRGLYLLLNRFVGHLQTDQLRYLMGRSRRIYEADAERTLGVRLPQLCIMAAPETGFAEPTIMTADELAAFRDSNPQRFSVLMRVDLP